MIEKSTVMRFKGKFVGIVRIDAGRDFFSRGTITEVSDSALILEFQGRSQAISLDSIKNIRELEGSE